MREFLTLLTAVAILAIAQTLYAALAVALLMFAVMGVVAFPKRTFQLIGALGLLALALRAPAACAAAIGAMGVTAVTAGCFLRRKPPALPMPMPLLPRPDRNS